MTVLSEPQIVFDSRLSRKCFIHVYGFSVKKKKPCLIHVSPFQPNWYRVRKANELEKIRTQITNNSIPCVKLRDEKNFYRGIKKRLARRRRRKVEKRKKSCKLNISSSRKSRFHLWLSVESKRKKHSHSCARKIREKCFSTHTSTDENSVLWRDRKKIIKHFHVACCVKVVVLDFVVEQIKLEKAKELL